MVLGGYSVLDDSVSCPTQGMLELENELIKAQKYAASNNAPRASHHSWLNYFMGSGGDLEHLAFLSLWLSRFVFPKNYLIEKRVFSMAIRLARGTQLALAPAVLSSIYGDLGLLKQSLIDSTKLLKDELVLITFAPFQLVQLWAWERFPVLRPTPNPISNGEPRSARWDKLKVVNCEQNIRSAIECAGECFQWRPYAMAVKNWSPPMFYQDKEQWVSVDSSLDKELESFARCLRVCVLVGLDYIQQYLPHRVAMQFGMDQDLPACVEHVPQLIQNPQLAWNNYGRSIEVAKIYIPHRLMECDVTTQYFKWWQQSMLGQKDSSRSYVRRHKDSAEFQPHPVGEKEDDHVSEPPAFSEKYQLEINKEDCNVSVPFGFSQKYQKSEVRASCEGDENSVLGSLGKPKNEENKADFEVKSWSASHCQVLSVLKKEDGAGYKMESVTEPATEVLQRKGSVSVQENAMSYTIEGEEGHLAKDIDGENSSRLSTLKMLEWELEDRISRLEGAVAELKAEWLGHNFDKKLAKVGSSNIPQTKLVP